MTRNIGLPVIEPKKKPVKNENNNPFNGSLTIRGKLFEGIVINAKAKGTAVIQKEIGRDMMVKMVGRIMHIVWKI